MVARNSEVASPCLGLCDVYDGFCTACLRDIDEINNWYNMSDEQKLKLRAVLDLRHKEAEALELKSRK